MRKKIVILTGAGMSAESGIQTFRDAGGLWEGYDVMEVASPEGWRANPELVLDFYNQRRRQLLTVKPNVAHHALTELEICFNTVIITQNIDDLHERAGSANVIHLHGELLKSRSTKHEHLIYECRSDINFGDTCEFGTQLRPHIVWFGEAVPMLEKAVMEIVESDIVIIIGTSMQVYPAAGLASYAPRHVPMYYIDPAPHLNYELTRAANLKVIPKKATEGIPDIVSQLIEDLMM